MSESKQRMLELQKSLSEMLLLLEEFGYMDSKVSYFDSKAHRHRDSLIVDEIRILDAIAALLTSGRPGDTTAVAFHRDPRLRLILSKNRRPTPDDVETARSLISTILSPSTNDPTDLSHFLLAHCRENMQKQVNKLHQSLSDFYISPPGPVNLATDFDVALSRYTPAPIEQEFAPSRMEKRPSFEGTIRNLFETSIKLCEYTFPVDPANPKAEVIHYAEVFLAATYLLNSRFLKTLFTDVTAQTCEQIERAKKLKQRLRKVCKFYVGIARVIQAAKLGEYHDIPFHWVDETLEERFKSGEGEITLRSDYLEILQDMFGHPIQDKTRRLLTEKFPHLAFNWENRRHLTTHIHAEIRIILYFWEHDLAPYVPRRIGVPSVEIPIGCSRRTCLCCTSWIDSYGWKFRISWITSRSHGKPDATWALPGAVGWKYQEGSWKGRFDADAFDDVTRHLRRTSLQLFSRQKTVYKRPLKTKDKNKFLKFVDKTVRAWKGGVDW